jgi:hypothetical protein
MSLEPFVNTFRQKRLGLPPIRRGEHGWNLLNTNKVPFLKMWSKHLVPKPKDWGPHVEVAGFFLEPIPPLSATSTPAPGASAGELGKASDSSSSSTGASTASGTASASITPNHKSSGTLSTGSATPGTGTGSGAKASVAATVPSAHLPPELEDFLRCGPPPVFVGFGSMVVDDALSLVQVCPAFYCNARFSCFALTPHFSQVLLEGAALVGVRIIFQSGWTEISEADFETIATRIEARKIPRRTFSETSSSSSSSSANPGRKSAEVASSKFVVARPWTTRDALLIGSCAHDKLFPMVAAVIHHGGAGEVTIAPPVQCLPPHIQWLCLVAYHFPCYVMLCYVMLCYVMFCGCVKWHGLVGTTAAGLRAGKPTMICPFFGDQHFWGHMVHKAFVGPEPCPVQQVSLTPPPYSVLSPTRSI